MNQLYNLVGITKQAHHQHEQRRTNRLALEDQLLYLVKEIRRDHPGMGARDIYHMLQPEGIGRDRFERLLLRNNYGVKKRRNFRKTTYVQGFYNFPNLINGLELTRPNQVWQTDITYYQVGNRFCYLVFIVDLYTRMIVGATASENLKAEATLNTLKMALKATKTYGYSGLIHHSDRGKQYTDSRYLRLLLNHGIRLSHAYAAIENAYAERINGIIKNDYLNHFRIESFPQLKSKLKQVVYSYNHLRPHKGLPNKMSPVQFVNSNEKYTLKVFNFNNSY